MKKIIISILIISGIVWWLAARPSQGKITYKKNEVKEIVESKKRFEGENISFDYWPGYEVRVNGEDNYSLIGPSGKSDVWAIMITKGVSFDESSGVIMRRVKKNVYEEIPYKKGVVFFNKNDGEKVYFENTKKGLLSVAVVNLAEMNKFEELVESIK